MFFCMTCLTSHCVSRPQKDTYYDYSIEEKEIEKENDKKEQQARQSKIGGCVMQCSRL